MEFKCVDGHNWQRRDLREPKNGNVHEIKNATRFTIITEQKTVVPIPNFIQTRHAKERRVGKVHDRHMQYYKNLVPYFRKRKRYRSGFNRTMTYCCNLLTGQWRRIGDDRCLSGQAAKENAYRTLGGKLRKLDRLGEIRERRLKLREVLDDCDVPVVLQSIVCDFI